MYVERKPPLWPYLSALVLLLTLCVVAPHYWRTQQNCAQLVPLVNLAIGDSLQLQSTDQPPRARVSFVPRSSASGVRLFVAASVPESLPPPPPQLVHFVSSRSGRTVWIAPPRPAAALDQIVPGMDLAAPLSHLGRQLAGVQPSGLISPLEDLLANWLGRWTNGTRTITSPPSLAGPILVSSSGTRLAMVPQRANRQPSLKLPAPVRQPETPPTADPNQSAWNRPTQLIAQLERLETFAATSAWASEALGDLEAVLVTARDNPNLMTAELEKLNAVAAIAQPLAVGIREPRLRTELLRAHYGLTRRATIWQHVQQISRDGENAPHARLPGREQLRKSLDELARLTSGSQRGLAWRDYLRLDPLDAVAQGRTRLSPSERRQLAQDILARVSSGHLNNSQRQFISSDAVASLTDELRHWAAEPIDVAHISNDLEDYERTRNPRLAQQIAVERTRLAWSPNAAHRDLATQINEHYRNANIRVAISQQFVRELLPKNQAELRTVCDCIVGTPVRGIASTQTVLDTRLIPDEHHWRMLLVARGQVDSHTVADGGAARLWSLGNTSYHAEKLLVGTPAGMQAWPATARAENSSQLVRVRTDYDGVPLVGEIVQQQALKQYRRKRAAAQAEVEFKTAQRASRELDAEADEEIARLDRDLESRRADLRKAGIELQTIEMRTTSERLIARLRVADDDQLAAHTPRHRAPADSLASLQLHESVLTNAARTLELEGLRATAPELQELLAAKLPGVDAQPEDDVNADTVFHFDYEDALTFQIEDGELELTLSLLELVHDKRSVRNFKVHATYQPRIEGMRVTLVRDGALGIEGRIRARERARLHGVFNRVFREDEEIPLLDLERMGLKPPAGMMVTQAVMEEGWLGIAIGPQWQGRTAQLHRCLR